MITREATTTRAERRDTFDDEHPSALLGVGSNVIVETVGAHYTWPARISYVSGEIFGLRGSLGADHLFAPRDVVTLRIGRNLVTLESRGRVLASGSRTLRVLAKRGVGGLERRESVRVQVSHEVHVTPIGFDAPAARDATLLDLSLSGCAFRSDEPIDVGLRVVVEMAIGRVALTLEGEVVRTWTMDASLAYHAGVQFDPLSAQSRALIQRFFVEHVRSAERDVRAERPGAVFG